MTAEAAAPLIAIVDDDESFRKATNGLIRSAGYRSVMFASGAAFLDSGLTHEIRCLILDIDMPGLNGLAVQRRLAEMNIRIPTIVVSGHEGELREMAREQGAFAVLPKTFGGKALLSIIKSALLSGRG
jgi:FixJ family two-component response regulator